MKLSIAFLLCSIVAAATANAAEDVSGKIRDRAAANILPLIKFFEAKIPFLNNIVEKVKESELDESIKEISKKTICADRVELLKDIVRLIRQGGLKDVFNDDGKELVNDIISLIGQGAITSATSLNPATALAYKLAQYIICYKLNNAAK